MERRVGGSCLCGGVRFEVRGSFLRAGHCHCSRCRKHSGTAVCTQGRVRREQFRLLAGDVLLRVYRPGAGSRKVFCRRCGSSLFGGTWPEGPEVSIRLGALDDDPGIRPQDHTFVDSRAAWDEISDELPQYAAGRGPGQRPRLGTRELALRFFEAWRAGSVDDLRRCLVPRVELDGGTGPEPRDAATAAAELIRDPARGEAQLVDVVAAPGRAVLLYEHARSRSRAAWFIDLDAGSVRRIRSVAGGPAAS